MCTQKNTCNTAELAWMCITLLTALQDTSFRPPQQSCEQMRTAASHPTVQSDIYCISSASLRQLKLNTAELLTTAANARARPQARSRFGHKHDALCQLFGISQRQLRDIFKRSGCTQHQLLQDAFVAAVDCIQRGEYGLNFTPLQIVIAEIKNRVTPKAPRKQQPVTRH